MDAAQGAVPLVLGAGQARVQQGRGEQRVRGAPAAPAPLGGQQVLAQPPHVQRAGHPVPAGEQSHDLVRVEHVLDPGLRILRERPRRVQQREQGRDGGLLLQHEPGGVAQHGDALGLQVAGERGHTGAGAGDHEDPVQGHPVLVVDPQHPFEDELVLVGAGGHDVRADGAVTVRRDGLGPGPFDAGGALADPAGHAQVGVLDLGAHAVPARQHPDASVRGRGRGGPRHGIGVEDPGVPGEEVGPGAAEALHGGVRRRGEQHVPPASEHGEQVVHGGGGLVEVLDHEHGQAVPLRRHERLRRGVALRVLGMPLGEHADGGGQQPGGVERLGHAQVDPVPVVLQQHGRGLPLGAPVGGAELLQAARLEAELAHAVHELADLTAESPRLHGGGDVVRPVRRGGEAGGVALEQLGDHRVLLGTGEQPGGDLQMPQRSRDAGTAQQVERVGGPGPHGGDGAGAPTGGGEPAGQRVTQPRRRIPARGQQQEGLGVQPRLDPAGRVLDRHGGAPRAGGAQHEHGAVPGGERGDRLLLVRERDPVLGRGGRAHQPGGPFRRRRVVVEGVHPVFPGHGLILAPGPDTIRSAIARIARAAPSSGSQRARRRSTRPAGVRGVPSRSCSTAARAASSGGSEPSARTTRHHGVPGLDSAIARPACRGPPTPSRPASPP